MKDDLISRQTVIDALVERTHMDWEFLKIIYPMFEVIDNMSSIQSERKKGKWKRHNTYHGDDTSGFVDPDWRCSECNKQANINEWLMYDLTDFCPNCGADMRGEQNG